MKKFTVLLGIATSLFIFNKTNAQQDSISNAELLKRIEKLEAEQKKPKEWDASIYGWVRTEYNFDSRQSAYAREYNLNLYPLDEKLDANGKDINAAGASNFLMRGVSGTRILDNVWRASARVEFKQNKFNIAPEIEYTAAKYGDTQPDATAGGKITNIANLRGILRVMYSF